MSGDFRCVFSGDEAEMLAIPFQNLCQRGWNVVRQTDVMARQSNNDREIVCYFLLISLCSVLIFCKIINSKRNKKSLKHIEPPPAGGGGDSL